LRLRRDLRGFMQQDEDLFPEKLRKALPPKPYLGVNVANAYIDNVRRFIGLLRYFTHQRLNLQTKTFSYSNPGFLTFCALVRT